MFYPVATRRAVIIPALNESKTIGSVMDRIPERDEWLVIVVDDGSTDSTGEIATARGARVVRHATPLGVGAAFHRGLKEALVAGAEIIVNIDGDGQFNPEDIPTLVAPILNGTADFVTASRFKDPALIPEMPSIKKWGNRQVTRMVNWMTGHNFSDVSCGFRAYNREAALRLTLFGKFTYTQETLIDLAFKGVRIAEVPLKVRGVREYGTSRVASNLWRYALKSATIMFRAGRDYIPHYFFGLPGVLLCLMGVAGAMFLTAHFVTTGQTSPYRSLVTLSGVFIIVGILLLFISLLADMLHRMRLIQEETIYLTRRSAYAASDDDERHRAS